MKRNKAWIAILMAFCMVFMFVGCSSKASSARSDNYYAKSEAAYEPYEMEVPAAMAEDAAYGNAKAAGKVSTATTASNGESANLTGNAAGRKIIKNGNMSIQTREFDAFMENLNQTILAMGGYVESSGINGNSYGRNSMRSADITVRIPADNLDAFCDQVSDIGNVTYKNLSTRDVTLTYVDLESHVKALRTEQEALLELLRKAEKVEDIITIQSRLSDVLYEIESYESTLRTFDDQITYSSVHLSIQEVERETTVEKETAGQEISRRFKENWEDVKEGFARFGINFVSDLPIIIVWVLILGGIAFIIVRIVKGGPKRKARQEKRKAMKLQKKYQKEQAKLKQQESVTKLPNAPEQRKE
jgi:hypothetical protein